MTCLPSARVKSPVWEATTLKFGSADDGAKPFFRSMAGAEPVVPCSSTMLTVAGRCPNSVFDPLAGLLALLDEVRADEGLVQRGVRESTARSVRMTGILASLASRSTVSQPVSTTGEKAMTSTFCGMKERIALIWFSCFC